jgi:hypothetical protein
MMKVQKTNYAKAENKDFWLRHPVLGDPSFDSFEKLGKIVHKSEPPYEWAVNGSLFRDPKDGDWYCFVGLYGFGYTGIKNNFIIYHSKDEGKSRENLGPGFPK